MVKIGRRSFRFLALRFLDARAPLRQQVAFVPDTNTHIIDQSTAAAAAVTYYYVDDIEAENGLRPLSESV